jgi:hypothetical protein
MDCGAITGLGYIASWNYGYALMLVGALDLAFLMRPGEHEGAGRSAPRKIFRSLLLAKNKRGLSTRLKPRGLKAVFMLLPCWLF